MVGRYQLATTYAAQGGSGVQGDFVARIANKMQCIIGMAKMGNRFLA